jgi:hypothetical protein
MVNRQCWSSARLANIIGLTLTFGQSRESCRSVSKPFAWCHALVLVPLSILFGQASVSIIADKFLVYTHLDTFLRDETTFERLQALVDPPDLFQDFKDLFHLLGW